METSHFDVPWSSCEGFLYLRVCHWSVYFSATRPLVIPQNLTSVSFINSHFFFSRPSFILEEPSVVFSQVKLAFLQK